MDGCIDQEARDRIAKLQALFEQHSTDWWGPDKTNGKRSELVDVTKRLDDLETDWKHFNDTRESSCIGLKALNTYLATVKKEEGDMIVEREKGKQLMLVQWIQVVGLIVVALIGLLK